jgi:hypothetical protein
MTAYDQLTAEGYLEPRPGRGPWSRRTCRTSGGACDACQRRRRGPPADLVDRSAPPVLRRRTPRAAVRLPHGCDAARPVPRGPVGTPPAPCLAGPRVRPRVGDHVSLPGGRPPRGALLALVRTLPGGGAAGVYAFVGALRPERHGDRGARWLGDGRILALEDPAARTCSGSSRRSAPRRPTSRSTTAGSSSTACRRPGRRHGHAVVAVPQRRHDARRPTDAAARLGRPQRVGDHRGRLRQRAALRGPAAVARASTSRAGCSTWDLQQGALPGSAVGYAVVPRRTSRRSSRATRRATAAGGARAAGARAVPRRGPLRAAPGPAAGALRERQAALLATLATARDGGQRPPAAAGPTSSCGSRTCS